MNETLAKTGVGVGVTLFGVTLADISAMVTIFAGIAGGFASIAAGIYYLSKWMRERQG